MQNKIKTKAQQLAQNPEIKKAFMSMKPEKTVWGVVGVMLFFILPEVITFFWGSDIMLHAKEGLLITTSTIERQYYDMLLMIFEDGVSWLNLTIGFALLIWLFF